MRCQLSEKFLNFLAFALSTGMFVADAMGQKQLDRVQSQLTLRKSAETREYQALGQQEAKAELERLRFLGLTRL